MNVVQAFVGLGSNLDEPQQQVVSALVALNAVQQTKLICRSPCYRTAPLGAESQPDYINAVAQLTTTLDAHALLDELLSIEARHGRVRTAERWGPRTLDLDLLVFGDACIDDAHLTVPHPGIAERRFVLVPLVRIAPDLRIPGLASIAEMLETCPEDRIEMLDEIADGG